MRIINSDTKPLYFLQIELDTGEIKSYYVEEVVKQAVENLINDSHTFPRIDCITNNTTLNIFTGELLSATITVGEDLCNVIKARWEQQIVQLYDYILVSCTCKTYASDKNSTYVVVVDNQKTYKIKDVDVTKSVYEYVHNVIQGKDAELPSNETIPSYVYYAIVNYLKKGK